jgi:hypothetical protein
MGGRWMHKQLYKRKPQPAFQSHHQRHLHQCVLASIRLADAAVRRAGQPWEFRVECFIASA